ncbi:hypothetical protein PF002_g25762 [Phytophthora fragariae]|uniref:RxLR effector protein n=1 Tax=Phytophthora fragariae TaxID=53985 RepID=A0A6A3I955_9STRA|nr:hypothetical protein PF003_g2629 [Phytophthora fragariae]KAE8938574.1 hypothetical protein PF009_g11561 [Phytophthora fragariae]KAE8978002.1 hypothetical protein PF011_g23428 [Phytophthora fragariae]KAE9075650.1 hypothetical protein PF007_g24916 [Phytophthora fragariae]KAE9094690.1 hypothetical protein PF006_g24162 [Phytophthora fragariae]
MAKLSVLSSILLVCAIAVATAQDATNAGGQAGSVTSDPAAPPPATSPPTATAPPSTTNAPPAGPAWAGNPAPVTTDSGSGSFGSGGDIVKPVSRKPRTTSDSSRSQSSEPTPSEDSGARTVSTTTGGALGLAVLMGLAAML